MQFKGQLLLPDDTGPGLRVNIDVAEHHLAVESDGGGLGAWPLEAVAVERRGDVFALTVAGEPLQFVADDTIAFAYSGVPTIESVSRRPTARSSFRSMLDRIWNGPEQPARPPVVHPKPEPDEAPEAVEVPPSPSPRAAPIPGLDFEANEVLVEEDDEAHTGSFTPAAELPALWPSGEDLADSPGCPVIKGDGDRCESPILTGSGYCYPHDPKRAFEDRYQAAQEARARLVRDSTARLNRIYGRLDKAMRQVERGELDPETAMAMAQIARTMCAILDIDEPS